VEGLDPSLDEAHELSVTIDDGKGLTDEAGRDDGSDEGRISFDGDGTPK